MTSVSLKPIGFVHSSRLEVRDDNWDNETAYIELTSDFNEVALKGLSEFSHIEVIYYMNQVNTENINYGARHPRDNESWPSVGIFAQRGKDRPNQIGLTICRIIKVERTKMFIEGLDAIDGTPVLDIKPWMKEFGPKNEVFQPKWATELMVPYWNGGTK